MYCICPFVAFCAFDKSCLHGVVLVVVSRKILLPVNYFSWNKKAEEILQCQTSLIITSVNLKLHYLCSPRPCCYIPQYGQVWWDPDIIVDLFWVMVFGSNLIYTVHSAVLTLNTSTESTFLFPSIAFSKQDSDFLLSENRNNCTIDLCVLRGWL